LSGGDVVDVVLLSGGDVVDAVDAVDAVVLLSGGDVIDADGLSYASESTAAILMLVFQYVTNGGMAVSVH